MLHAQDIVFELRTSLRTDAWAGAHGLAALYAYVESRLVQANIQKDAAIVIECRGHLEPLRDAFREAADIVTAEQAERATLVASARPPAPSTSTPSSRTSPTPRLPPRPPHSTSPPD